MTAAPHFLSLGACVQSSTLGPSSRRRTERLDQVLAAHAATVKIIHTLTPIGVAMAGAGEVDPYKD